MSADRHGRRAALYSSSSMRTLATFTAAALWLFAPSLAVPLAAQQTSALTEAANAITTADLARHIGAITADSFGGRDTPSRGLELTAQYLIAEFQRLGLTPSYSPYDTASWIMRYPVPGHEALDRAKTQIQFGKTPAPGELPRDGSDAAVNFAATAWPLADTLSWSVWRRSIFRNPSTTLVAGRQTAQSMRRDELRGTHILYVPPAGLDSLAERRIVDALRVRAVGMVVLAGEDSVTFARHVEVARRRPLYRGDLYMADRLGGGSWVAHVWPPAVWQVLVAAGIDLAALRQDTTAVVRDVPLSIDLFTVRDTTQGPPPTAPNVVAELTGSDPKLKGEYLVYTAHMDNAGAPGGPSDNAAGVAGLLALAKAFSQPGARPKRSVLFLATSGGVKDWWGVRYVETALVGGNLSKNVVTSVHLDALDRGVDDSVIVDGIGDFAALRSPIWLAVMHPELGLTVIDGGPVDRSRDNHGAFLQRTRPSLAFHGRAARAGPITAGAPSMQTDALARVLRLAFYTGYDLANGETTPRWSDAGQRQLRRVILDD